MLNVRYWPAAVGGWLLSVICPRLAAASAHNARLRAIQDWRSDAGRWQQERDEYAAAIADIRQRFDDVRQEHTDRLRQAERAEAALRDSLAEAALARDKLQAENEVQRHQLEVLGNVVEAFNQLKLTESHIEAAKRGRGPPDEPLHRND